MPIAGIIGFESASTMQSQIERMTSCTHHENWYIDGYYMNESMGIAVGWSGDANSFSMTPVRNETRDILLVLSGECYIDRDDLRRLRTKGHVFRDTGNEFMVHLYEEDPESFFKKLNGYFCGLLVDMRRNIAMLFNDRYGMGRVYCYSGKGKMFFSTEVKSILRLNRELKKIDPKGLGELFTCECVLENRTLFPDIHLLPPGSLWLFMNRQILEMKSYFNKSEWENCEIYDDDVLYGKLVETLRMIIPRYLDAPSDIGLSLTGGLDCRTLLSLCEIPRKTIKCYSFGSAYRDNHDVKIARKVAKLCGQTHRVLEVGTEFLDHFPDLARKTVEITDGIMDVTGAADLYVNRMAREIAPIRLTGNYGQEVLIRSVSLKKSNMYEKIINGDFVSFLQDAHRTYDMVRRDHPLSFVAFCQIPFHHYKRFYLETSQLRMRSPFLDNDLVALMYHASTQATANRNLCLRLIKENNPQLAGISTDRGCLGTLSLLHPFKRGYFEFEFKMEYYSDYGMPQWVAGVANTLSRIQPERLFLGRHKFHHFRIWYRGPLANYVKEILLDPKTLGRPYLDKNYIKEIVLKHTNGERNHTLEISKLLTTELMHRSIID